MKTVKNLGCCVGLIIASQARALETAPGDYEQLPVGKTAVLLYYQHAQGKEFYQGGDRVSNDFRLRSDIGLLRAIHAVALGEGMSLEPQVILPFGQLRTGGDASPLGRDSGVGDIIFGAPIKVRLDTRHGDVFAFGPYLYAPTGSYDRDQPLNLGENHWRLTLQTAYIHHFDEHWALDTVADVSWFSRNDDFTPAGVTLRQQVRYEYQTYLRYQWTAATTLGVGGGYVSGGRTEVDGVSQDDRLRTSYARLTLTHFLAPDLQVQVQAGRDLSVAQGVKEEGRLNLRLLKLF